MNINAKEQTTYTIELTEDEFIKLWASVGGSYFKDVQEILVDQGRSDLVYADIATFDELTDFGLEKGIIKEF